MKFFRKLGLATSVTLMLTQAAPAFAVTEISWWHSMTGALGDRVNNLADQFNKSQAEYKVVPVYKGEYDESLSAAIAAFRAGNAPDILQVFEVMKIAGEKFEPAAYIPAVASYYTAPNGEMLSLPFNSSTAVFFYNKDLFAKAGLDPNKPPTTWQEMVSDAARLKVAGSKCPYTTGWQTWIQLENFSAWHNIEFATKNNGFGGLDARLNSIVLHMS